MKIVSRHRLGTLIQVSVSCLIALSVGAHAQEATDGEPTGERLEGPRAAYEFEREFRDLYDYSQSKPVDLDRCENITELTTEFWTKKHVLSDFKKHRREDQVGVIVIVKTENCCDGSRLCAVTTASMEKKSTPLVRRFRVYAAWIRSNPDHPYDEWNQWEEDVVREYDFIQGPGARVAVMVPTWDGKMFQWQSTATELDLSGWMFDNQQGETPKLEAFLEEAIRYAPEKAPPLDSALSKALSQNLVP